MKFLTEAEVQCARLRTADPAWRGAIESLETKWREGQHLAMPREGAGWLHDYYCTEHAVQLTWNEHDPHGHVCHVDGKVFSGEKYDAAWRYLVQCKIVAAMKAAADLWLLTGQAQYLAHAVLRLEEYSACYAGYPVHGSHAGQGRCMGQSLCEAVWAISVAQAYDSIATELTSEQQTRFRSALLGPITEHLKSQRWRRIHNIECWHLAGLATLAVVLEDDALLGEVLDVRPGLKEQIDAGIRDDGWWYEGSPTYHWYTLDAILHLLRAVRHARPDVLKQDRLKAMLDAPLQLMRDDFSLPSTNDGWHVTSQPGSIRGQATKYEIAWGLWGEERHRQLLGNLYQELQSSRKSLEALLYGPETLAAQSQSFKSTAHWTSGYGLLRSRGEDRQQAHWLMLKTGSHGGSHGHYDKLAVQLWAYGEELAGDLGTPGYGIPLNKLWYRHSISHNAFLIAGREQPEIDASLVRFVAEDSQQGCAGVLHGRVQWHEKVDPAYQNVQAERAVLSRIEARGYWIDVLKVASPTPQTIEWVWHQTGSLTLEGARSFDWNQRDATYGLLTDLQENPSPMIHAMWRTPSGIMTRLWGNAVHGVRSVAARGPGNPVDQSRGVLLRQAHGTDVWFVSVMETSRGNAGIDGVKWLETGAGEMVLVIESARWKEAWVIDKAGMPRKDYAALKDLEVRTYGM